MDLRRLREETRTEHEATEAAMPLTGPMLTLGTYKRVLRLLLPVLRSWEAWAGETAPASLHPLLAARRRSHWLEQDLLAMGDSQAMLDSIGSEPIWWSAVVEGTGARSAAEFGAAFLGAFYVLEGSTLGGRLIARHVEQVLGVEPGHGDAYFRGHGEQTGALWRETTESIAAVPEEFSELVIGAARRTFLVFRTVLETLDLISADETTPG